MDNDTGEDLIDALHRRWQQDRDVIARQAGEQSPFESPQAEHQWARNKFATYIEEHNRERVAAGHAPVGSDEEAELVVAAFDKAYGLGRLDQLLRDPNVTDVHVFSWDHTMVRGKDGAWRRSRHPIAKSNAEVIRLIQNAAARHGTQERRWDQLNPELNMQLRDGSRLFAVRDVIDAPRVVIRKHDDRLASLPDLVPTGFVTPQAAHFLEKSVQGRLNTVIVGETGSGKAHPLSEPLPTPNGWKSVGDLTVADEVYGADGSPVKLLGLSPIRNELLCTVTFEDGRTVRCSPDHLWEVVPTRPTHGHLGGGAATAQQLVAQEREASPDWYATLADIAAWSNVPRSAVMALVPHALGVESETGRVYPVREAIYRYRKAFVDGEHTTVLTAAQIAEQVRHVDGSAAWAVVERHTGTSRTVCIDSVDIGTQRVPMRCLYVDSVDHLYLVGDHIPTHNTTLLRALCAAMSPNQHKVTVEEAKEIGLERDRRRHPLVTALETRAPDMQGNGAVPAQQLVRMSLRMDPDRIIMGEVRGGEALQMLTAMTQGQAGSMCTMHGESAKIAYPRLMLYVKFGDIPISDEDVARLIADAVHFVVFAAKVPAEDGKTYKRVIDHIIETRGVNGTQITSNVIMSRDNSDGKNPAELLRPVGKPSERTMSKLLKAGFNFNFWASDPNANGSAQT